MGGGVSKFKFDCLDLALNKCGRVQPFVLLKDLR
jgi:hypothetical protein